MVETALCVQPVVSFDTACSVLSSLAEVVLDLQAQQLHELYLKTLKAALLSSVTAPVVASAAANSASATAHANSAVVAAAAAAAAAASATAPPAAQPEVKDEEVKKDEKELTSNGGSAQEGKKVICLTLGFSKIGRISQSLSCNTLRLANGGDCTKRLI